MACVWRSSFLFLWVLTACNAQDVFLERPVSQVVDLDSPAQLNCSANGSVSSIEWRRGQTVLTGSGRLTVAQGGIRISATQWADIGEYSCVATFMGREFSASATLNITGYVKPYVLGVHGFGAVSSTDREQVACPIGGNPGPELFFWQNATTGRNITTDTDVDSGLFVNSMGELDLSRARPEESGFYVCVGVDPAGNSANTTFRIDVEGEEEGLTPLEWYFILTYCAVAVLVLLIVVVLLYVFYSLRGFCFTRVAETRRVRTRVRREKPQKILLDDVEHSEGHP